MRCIMGDVQVANRGYLVCYQFHKYCFVYTIRNYCSVACKLVVTLLGFHPLTEKLELAFDKRRKQCHRKVLLSSFHSNVRGNGSFLTRKLEPPYAVTWIGLVKKR